MINKNILKLQNSFYTSLVLLFTLGSLLKTDYSVSIPVDFGGYSDESEISLVINPKTNNSIILFIDSNTKIFEFNFDTVQAVYNTTRPSLFKLKLNKYIFSQFVSSQYLHPDFCLPIRIVQKFNITHQSPDDVDPLIS